MNILTLIKIYRREFIVLLLVALLFLGTRIPGLDLPYHQDEMKTAVDIFKGGEEALSGLHHPPLTQILFKLDGFIFGSDRLRLMPFIFSILVCVFLYLIAKNKFGMRAPIFTLFVFSICSYAVFSSLMLDTDGAILPFFFLLSVYLYDLFKKSEGRKKYIYLGLLILSLLTGFLVKLSFVIAIGAIAVNFILDQREHITRKKILFGVVGGAIFFGASAILIFIIHLIYPVFKIDAMFSHALSYINFGPRNYLQVIIQALKSVYYLSPLLVLPLFLTSKEFFQKLKVFYIFLILGFIFYFILFDFSAGALDKYLMFAIVPLSIISGCILTERLKDIDLKKQKWSIGFGLLLSCALLAINFIPHSVISLYPKTEWFSRVLHLNWLMLNPFTGGNGPLGFYISFLFIALTFIASTILIMLIFFKRNWERGALVILIMISFVYNAVFIEELIYGRINGSAKVALGSALLFIENSPEIKKVITYNDSGTYELVKMGKSSGRFYAVPSYENVHKKLFRDFEGHFLVVDIPHLYQDGFYADFFSTCKIIYKTNSVKIDSFVYDCKDSTYWNNISRL